jgi:hypothetical protein
MDKPTELDNAFSSGGKFIHDRYILIDMDQVTEHDNTVSSVLNLQSRSIYFNRHGPCDRAK